VPDLSHALTAEQVDAAWRKFAESMMIVTGAAAKEQAGALKA
jgi:hypothetical protein